MPISELTAIAAIPPAISKTFNQFIDFPFLDVLPGDLTHWGGLKPKLILGQAIHFEPHSVSAKINRDLDLITFSQILAFA